MPTRTVDGYSPRSSGSNPEPPSSDSSNRSSRTTPPSSRRRSCLLPKEERPARGAARPGRSAQARRPASHSGSRRSPSRPPRSLAAFLLADGSTRLPPSSPTRSSRSTPRPARSWTSSASVLGPSKPAIVGNYVFVSSDDREILSRIDVRSGEVDDVRGPHRPGRLYAAGADGTLWVGSSVREQGVADRRSTTSSAPGARAAAEDVQPWAVAVGGGSVWVSHNFPPPSRASTRGPGSSSSAIAHPLSGVSPPRSRSARGRPGRQRMSPSRRRAAADRRRWAAACGIDRDRKDSARAGRRTRRRLGLGSRPAASGDASPRPGRFSGVDPATGSLGRRDPRW